MLDASNWRGHSYRIGEINNIDVTKAVSFVHITFIHSFIHSFIHDASECKKYRPKLCNDEKLSCSLTQVAAHACLFAAKAPTSGHPLRHRTQHSSHTLPITLSQPQQLYLLFYSPSAHLKPPKLNPRYSNFKPSVPRAPPPSPHHPHTSDHAQNDAHLQPAGQPSSYHAHSSLPYYHDLHTTALTTTHPFRSEERNLATLATPHLHL